MSSVVKDRYAGADLHLKSQSVWGVSGRGREGKPAAGGGTSVHWG